MLPLWRLSANFSPSHAFMSSCRFDLSFSPLIQSGRNKDPNKEKQQQDVSRTSPVCMRSGLSGQMCRCSQTAAVPCICLLPVTIIHPMFYRVLYRNLINTNVKHYVLNGWEVDTIYSMYQVQCTQISFRM